MTQKAIKGIMALLEEGGATMGRVSVSELKDGLSEFINRAAFGHERIVILSRGKPKAAVIGVRDLERLEDLEDAQAARDTLAAHQAGETIPWEQVKADLAGVGAERV